MVCSEFAYYVPRILNRTVLQFNFGSVPYLYHSKKGILYQRTVPYFLAKIEVYRTYVSYRTALCHSCFHLLATLTDFEITSL